jgi:cytochrome oxidase assembly protein ShyY1
MEYRFLLRPKWIAFHVLVAGFVVAMVSLGFWQLRRLDQRQQFNAEVRANANAPIEPITLVLTSEAAPSAIEWRRVRVTGTYLPDHQLLVVNRSQNGSSGRNIVDSLQLVDGSLLLVNRGFVAAADGIPATPTGTVELIGRLRVSEQRRTGQLSDDGAGKLSEIHRIDIPVLRSQFSQPTRPMYVEALASTRHDAATLQPIVAPTLDDGPHLSYAIQWFIFSTAVIAGWVLAVRRSQAMRSGKTGKTRGSSYVPIAEEESVS